MGRENAEAVITAYDAGTGETLWGERDVAGNLNEAQALQVDPTGQALYVTGETVLLAARAATTISLDPGSGDRLWTARYPGAHGASAPALGGGTCSGWPSWSSRWPPGHRSR